MIKINIIRMNDENDFHGNPCRNEREERFYF